MGEATAKMNIADLKKILNIPESPDSSDSVTTRSYCSDSAEKEMSGSQRIQRVRRESMEQLSLIKVA